MRRSAILITILAISALASGLANAARISNVVSLTTISQVPTGSHTTVCATAIVTYVNVNNLRWTLRRHDSKLKLLSGMPANCREYYAPTVAGWDRITVSYNYRGNKYYAATRFTTPSPQRP
jgi:hypothetical protein